MKYIFVIFFLFAIIFSNRAIQLEIKNEIFSDNAKIFFDFISKGDDPFIALERLSNEYLIPFTDGKKITYIYSFSKNNFKMKKYKNSNIYYLTFNYKNNEIDNTTYYFEIFND